MMKARHVVLAGAAALVVFAGVCWVFAHSRRLRHWPDNVLLITLDTTRADRLGCYGYAGAETPALDNLARGGVRFSRAYTHVPLTLCSHATMMTGLLPPEHGLRDNGWGSLDPSIPTLAESFRSRGYRTAAFLASFSLDKRFGLNRGFDMYDDRMEPAVRGGELLTMETPGNVVCDRALAWLEKNGRKRFFCWVHFYDPHLPYAPPASYRAPHKDPYDGEVAFMDAQIKRLVDFLDKAGLAGRTLIVACGDHGEALAGEHGEVGHGQFVYDATLRVPLLLYGPGVVPAGKTDDRVAGIEDIAPTLEHLLGWGRSEALRGHDLLREASSECVCYGESLSAYLTFGWSPLYSLTTRRWKYIECPDPELYDLAADPGETRNLARAEPSVASGMAGRLERLRQGLKATQPGAVPLDPAALRTLRSLGYLAGNPSPAPTDGKTLKDPKAMGDVYRACHETVALVNEGRYREAVDTLGPLAARSPESVQIHQILAQCYSRLKVYDAAARSIEAALSLTPRNRMLMVDLAVARMQQGDPTNAVDVLRRGLTMPQGPLEPTTGKGVSRVAVEMHADLANALCQLGRTDEAERHGVLALNNDPENLDAHTTLGTICSERGRYDKAVRHYQAVLSREPANPVAWSNLG